MGGNILAYKDLREFIAALEARGWLRRIAEPVDCYLEITEITDRVSKLEGDGNKALLFEHVKGYDMPVLMNAFGSYERMALALGVEKLDDVGDEIREILRLLEERPNAIGLAVPAMPIGSPGMDGPEYGRRRDPYDVLLLARDGTSRIFQSYR